ncbi:MAG TPA: hypothetical protein PLA94_20940, partial [Myxococcota bacterium]|nr:hypothetical protein [Myxococcota bacterium]
VSDGVVIGNAPPSLDRAYVESRYPLMIENGLILAFPESTTCNTAAAALPVDLLASNMVAGTIYKIGGPRLWAPTNTVEVMTTPLGLGGNLAAGTKYQCVLAHFEGVNDYTNPTATSITQWGSMHFSTNILAIQYTNTGLDNTDNACGVADIHASVRGTEADWDLNGATEDALQYVGSRDLKVQASTTGSTDTMRIFVACK